MGKERYSARVWLEASGAARTRWLRNSLVTMQLQILGLGTGQGKVWGSTDPSANCRKPGIMTLTRIFSKYSAVIYSLSLLNEKTLPRN